MHLVDMTDWQKIREANPSAAVPVVCDAWTTWWHHSLLPWFSFAQGRGKGQRHRETGAFHIIPFLLEDFECFFEACPKQHRWPAYFPARAGRCRDKKLAWFPFCNFRPCFLFWRYCFSTKFYLFRISQISFTWCFWCQAIMTWWRQTCEPTLERWWISALPTGVASEIHGVFGTQLSWCIKWPVDTYMSRETAKIGLWGGMKAF